MARDTRVVGLNEVQNAIMRELRLYENHVSEQIETDAKAIAAQLVTELKQTSPKRYGDYAAGWTKSKFKKGWIVHNKTRYRLTHLLEKPHAKRGGGKTTPQPHIRPAEERTIRAFIERVERAVEGN